MVEPTLLLPLIVITAVVSGAPLSFPPELVSVNGTLSTNLTLELATYETNGLTLESTRLFNGILPGPTLRLFPGDTLEIFFANRLPDEGIPFQDNRLSAPDETNLHFHGLHVSGELPSDDTTLTILPQTNFLYRTVLPQTHMPGTHWMHPHRHGSTALHVSGGAVGAIIVEDAPGSLPDQVEGAREILLIVMQIDIDDMEDIADDTEVELLGTTTTEGINRNDEFILINGQIMPSIAVDTGEWVRFRIVYAAWKKGKLDLEMDGCEMQLLAKDGVYIRDFPRPISVVEAVPAGRADVMVRCPKADTVYPVTRRDGTFVATIETTVGPTILESSDLEPWSPNYPPYLADLRDVEATPGCTCTTKLGGGGINGRKFQSAFYLHESVLGAVLERKLSAGGHPFHQHVQPFQLVSGFQANDYYRLGDWHDTIQDNGVVRWSPLEFTGKYMIHCHRIKHEDTGMMSIEFVHPNITESRTCVCGSVVDSGLEGWEIALISVGGFIFCLLVLGVVVWQCRKRGKCRRGV